MRPEDFDVQKLIEDLQGTCSSIDDHLPEGMNWENLTDEDHEAIDNEIFLCAECGWWCEACESNDKDGEIVCDDCKE
jgi:hypothetical protein